MAEPLGIAAGVIGITSTALHGIKLLLDDLENLKNAPKTVKRLQEDLYSVETVLTALKAVGNQDWEDLGESIAEGSKTTMSTCRKACDQFRTDLERWTKHTQDGKFRELMDRAQVGFFKKSQIKALSEQLQNCKHSINCAVGTANLYSSIRTTHMTEEIRKTISIEQTKIQNAITSADKELVVLDHKLEELDLSSDEEEAENTKSKAQVLQQVEEERGAVEVSRKLLDKLLSKSQEKAVAKAAAENRSASTTVAFGNDNSGFQAGTIGDGVSNLTFGKK